MRTIAPRRTPRLSASMRPSGEFASSLMSIRASGRITSSFMRSINVVPPAR